MDNLLAYLNSLSKSDRAVFVSSCGTTEGYLRKAISKGQQLGESLCINIDRESRGIVTCESLRADVDFGYLRKSRPELTKETADA